MQDQLKRESKAARKKDGEEKEVACENDGHDSNENDGSPAIKERKIDEEDKLESIDAVSVTEKNDDEKKCDNSEQSMAKAIEKDDKKIRIGIDCNKEKRQSKVRETIAGRSYLSPLTTVGNLPFRRICTEFGAEVTCGEMAMASNLLKGHAGEWALLRRHASEKCFGVQLCGGNPDMMARCTELIEDKCDVDFIDINAACPLELVCKKGEGASLMQKPSRLYNLISAMRQVSELPISVKLRTGLSDSEDKRFAHEIVGKLSAAGADFVAIHGRTRDQRYTRLADWNYLNE